MTSPYVQNGIEKPKPTTSINIAFLIRFFNVRNNGMKCPYLPVSKEEHFKVVILEMIMFQFCSS